MGSAKHDDIFSLRWYRDQGRGQEAADNTNADQLMDGTWPIAVLPCDGYKDAGKRWKDLLDTYGVNATTYHPLVRAGD
jgi:hypothetical protein